MFELEYLAKAILWLKRRSWGLALLIAAPCWFLLVAVWAKSDEGSATYNIIAALFSPAYGAGHAIGVWFFPDYQVRQTTGSYVVPLFGAAAEIALLMFIAYVCIRVWRSLQPKLDSTN